MNRSAGGGMTHLQRQTPGTVIEDIAGIQAVEGANFGVDFCSQLLEWGFELLPINPLAPFD
jgi:hypothetical protein